MITLGVLLAVIILLPWYVVRGAVGPIPITLLECAIGLLVIVWLYEDRWYRSPIESLQRAWSADWWAVLLTLGFVAGASLSLLATTDLRGGLGGLKAYIIEPIVVGIILVRTVWLTGKWQWICLAIAAAGLQVSMVSFSQWLFGWPVLAPAEMSQGRMSSFFNTANAVGLFVGPIVAMCTVLAVSRLTVWGYRLWYAGVALAGGLAIVLSRSDGALFATMGCLIITGLWLAIRRLTWPVRIVQLLVVFCLIAYVAGSLVFVWWVNTPPSVANPYTRPGFSTFTVRQCLWQGTRLVLSDSPWLGTGLSGFPDQYVAKSTCDAEPLVYPHMLVLNFWTEVGLLGLTSMVGLMSVWLWHSVAMIREHDGRQWLGLAFMLPLVYWLIHGLVDVPYFKNDLAVLWWVFLALSLYLPRISRQQLKTMPAVS